MSVGSGYETRQYPPILHLLTNAISTDDIRPHTPAPVCIQYTPTSIHPRTYALIYICIMLCIPIRPSVHLTYQVSPYDHQYTLLTQSPHTTISTPYLPSLPIRPSVHPTYPVSPYDHQYTLLTQSPMNKAFARRCCPWN